MTKFVCCKTTQEDCLSRALFDHTMSAKKHEKPATKIAAKFVRPASLSNATSVKKRATSPDSSKISVISCNGQSTRDAKDDVKGPSLFAVFATKRLVRRFAEKVAAKRAERAPAVDVTPTQPTYQLQPRVKLHRATIARAIRDVAEPRLQSFTYSAKKSAMLSKLLSEDVKDKLKALGLERYKIVCLITIGEKKSQGVHVVSRCSWDANHDDHVTYNWQNAQIFCTITVYGLYSE